MAGPISPTGPGVFMFFDGATPQTDTMNTMALPGKTTIFLNKSPYDVDKDPWFIHQFIMKEDSH